MKRLRNCILGMIVTTCTLFDASGYLHLGEGRLQYGTPYKKVQGSCTGRVPSPIVKTLMTDTTHGWSYDCGGVSGRWSETIMWDGRATLKCEAP